METQYDSLADALAGTDAPFDIACSLVLLDVPYADAQGSHRTGQLVIHEDLAKEAEDIFKQLYAEKFPIHKMVPIVAYGWDDEASMADNNSSAFNYRKILGTERLSNHALGRALDINPLLNPYFAADGRTYPPDATYRPEIPGTITAEGSVVALFKEYGWAWGGDWIDRKDYQHFEKA